MLPKETQHQVSEDVYTEDNSEERQLENFTTVLFRVTCPRRLLTHAGDNASGYESHINEITVGAEGERERKGGRGPYRTSRRNEYSVSNCCSDRIVGFGASPLISTANISQS